MILYQSISSKFYLQFSQIGSTKLIWLKSIQRRSVSFPKKLATRVDMLNTYISRSPIEFLEHRVYFAVLQKINAQKMVRS
ncbi:hypothetical protein [Microcoleus sp. T3_D1]|uniref:hypothetical protein n=1 Tax=Microcoleus sp. T3_D1 TaxID=3055427 RepID=UPI002FD45B0F